MRNQLKFFLVRFFLILLVFVIAAQGFHPVLANEAPSDRNPPSLMPMPVLSAVCKSDDFLYILSNNTIFQLTNNFKLNKMVALEVKNNIEIDAFKAREEGKDGIDPKALRIFPTGICLDDSHLYVLIFGKAMKYSIPDLAFIEMKDLSSIIGADLPSPPGQE
jgi:hypothetical protein